MNESSMITLVSCITKIPVRKLRDAAAIAGSMSRLIRDAYTVDAPLTERQREVLSGLADIARYIIENERG